MKAWVDYYEHRATTLEDPLVVAEMAFADPNATERQLKVDQRLLLDYLQPEPGSSLLDLGCCTGNSIGLVKEHFAKVTGVDLAATTLEVARRLHPDVRFIEDDISTLASLGGERSSHILCFGVLHYLDKGEIERLLVTVSRHLDDGGRGAFVRVPSLACFDAYQAYRQQRNPTAKPKKSEGPSWYFVDPDWLREASDKTGLKCERLYHPHPEFPLRAFFDFIFSKG